MRWHIAATMASVVFAVVLSPSGTAVSAAEAETEAAAVAQWRAEAGVTPDSVLYPLDRGAERIRLALTRGDGRAARLQAQWAVERAAEANIMAADGKVELASRAAADSSRSLTEGAARLQAALSADAAVSTDAAQVALTAAHKRSVAALTQVQAKAPPAARAALQAALEHQERTVTAMVEFQAARAAFQAANAGLQTARRSLAAARRRGDAAGALAAEADVRAREDRKADLEALKGKAEQARAVAAERLDAALESVLTVEAAVGVDLRGRAGGANSGKAGAGGSGKGGSGRSDP